MNIQHSDARGSRTFIFSVIEKKKENKNRTQKAESKAIGNKQTKNKKKSSLHFSKRENYLYTLVPTKVNI